MSEKQAVAGAAPSIAVEVVHALPARQRSLTLHLPPGATVAEALAAWRESGGAGGELGVARYGRRLQPGDALADGDRLDILRPLTADPKEARRLRAERQAAGKAKRR